MEPSWIQELVKIVGNSAESHAVMEDFGYSWSHDDGEYVLIVYPMPLELVGTEVKGEAVVPGFMLNFGNIMNAFDSVVDTDWCSQSRGPHDREGVHIVIEGVFKGNKVCLYVLSEAPEEVEPESTLDISDGSVGPK